MFITDIVQRSWHAMQSLLFPEECFGCGAYGAYVCTRCDTEARNEQHIPHAFSVYSYRHPAIHNALYALKYRGGSAIARTFAEAMYNSLLEELSERNTFTPFEVNRSRILLIPIPLSKKRERERGYNQSLILAQHLAECGKEMFSLAPDVLIKTRETPAQTSLSRKERLKNLAGAFSVTDPKIIQGKTIFILDDVTTTGATLREAAKTLKKSGAKEVFPVTVAH